MREPTQLLLGPSSLVFTFSFGENTTPHNSGPGVFRLLEDQSKKTHGVTGGHGETVQSISQLIPVCAFTCMHCPLLYATAAWYCGRVAWLLAPVTTRRRAAGGRISPEEQCCYVFWSPFLLLPSRSSFGGVVLVYLTC